MAKSSTRIVTANRLHDGAVVYLTTAGSWAESTGSVALATTPAEEANLMQLASDAVANRLVVDPNAIDITGPDTILPTRLREQIRLRGPTVRPDLARH